MAEAKKFTGELSDAGPTNFITEIGYHHVWADSLLNGRGEAYAWVLTDSGQCSGASKCELQNSLHSKQNELLCGGACIHFLTRGKYVLVFEYSL